MPIVPVLPRFSNKHQVADLPLPTGGRSSQEYWHSSEEGFGVRVMASGTRAWLVRWKIGGAEKKVTIGKVSDVDIKDARDKARLLRKNARLAKDGSPTTPTLEEAYNSYLTGKQDKLRPATKTDYAKRWEHLKPEWHKPMDSMHVVEWEGTYKRVYTKSKRAMALGVLRLASSLYTRCIKRKELVEHPIRMFSEDIGLWERSAQRTDHVKQQNLPRFLRAVHLLGGVQRDYVLVGLFVGWRKGILDALRWERVNEENRTYFILASDPGNKFKRDVHYPIPKYLWEQVFAPRLAAKRDTDEWILPSPKKKGMPTHAIRGAFVTLSGPAGVDLSPHDLRRSFGTYAFQATKDLILVGGLMTHALPKGLTTQQEVTAGYIVVSPEAMRAGIEKVAAYTLEQAGINTAAA